VWLTGKQTGKDEYDASGAADAALAGSAARVFEGLRADLDGCALRLRVWKAVG
jgi:hypothetical protein